jgi:ring-1,2-phenylacetyl-CoA epoxidase subunit PaaC
MAAPTATLALNITPPLAAVLRLADTCLVHAQRLSQWCGHAPVLEEDVALANMALDVLGQSRALLTHAAALHGEGLDEDALAYWREASQFFNLTLVELPGRKGGADFADTLLRHYLLSAWLALQWQGLLSSCDEQLAAIAAKAGKETRYHLQHAADWVVRLGDGTEESARRMQRAVRTLWPYTAEMFEDDEPVDTAFMPRWSSLLEPWLAQVRPVFAEARLDVPIDTAFRSTGSRGVHSEHMGYLLAEMQSVQRAYPGGVW